MKLFDIILELLDQVRVVFILLLHKGANYVFDSCYFTSLSILLSRVNFYHTIILFKGPLIENEAETSTNLDLLNFFCVLGESIAHDGNEHVEEVK